MYFTQQMVARAERTYGAPACHRLSFAASARELQLIRGAQISGRRHDITLAIFGRDGVIVIAKPWYPSGVFRLPSGGLRPGESLEHGAAREAREETGAAIELVRYHLRIDVEFVGDAETIPWTSHVFSARYRGGRVAPADSGEIREARFCPLAELRLHGERMGRSRVSGFRYRARLQELLCDQLEDLGWLQRSGGSWTLAAAALAGPGEPPAQAGSGRPSGSGRT